jgi:hypothetical protein
LIPTRRNGNHRFVSFSSFFLVARTSSETEQNGKEMIMRRARFAPVEASAEP